MSRSVKIGTLPIRPLPRSDQGKASCTNCQAREARWEVGKQSLSCSLCFLYCAPVMTEQREALDNLIEDIENSAQKVFPKVEGKLADSADADCLVAAIVMTQRFELTRGLR